MRDEGFGMMNVGGGMRDTGREDERVGGIEGVIQIMLKKTCRYCIILNL